MIIATAGHVDHGKTLLVRALTGVDTDRLPEEKKRGLTIDLGFAYLPVDGETIGFVDVPGHERFVHNMLCGVAGIDAVMFIVAADDGPMPQTVEHLAILDLLGIRHGLVALTKIDRVPPERVTEVRAEIERMLAPTTLAQAPIHPVSAVSGEGIDALKREVAALAKSIPPRATRGNFRLAIDRVFTIAGAGLIVTGTVVAGKLAVGESVRTVLGAIGARVRSIHAQNAPAEIGQAGERCALNLVGSDLSVDRVARGDWAVAEPVAAPVAKFDARLRVLASEARALSNWTPVHVHLGAMDVTGRVATLEGPNIAAGGEGLVQLVLDRPIGALWGDRFIVRDQSAQRTIGGGRVVDIFPPARGRAKPERLAALGAQANDDAAKALEALLAAAPAGLDLVRFAANRSLTAEEAGALFANVPMHRVESIAFAEPHWQRLRTLAIEATTAFHRRTPDAIGIPDERLLEAARVARPVALEVAAELVREGRLARAGSNLHLPSHRAQFAGADAAQWARILKALEAAEARPPTVRELADALRADAKKTQSLLERAARQGLVYRVSETRFFLPGTVRRLAEIVEEITRRNASRRMIAAEFRDQSAIGRNLSIEVLEFFDRVKFTRRIGDAREVVKRARELFG